MVVVVSLSRSYLFNCFVLKCIFSLFLVLFDFLSLYFDFLILLTCYPCVFECPPQQQCPLFVITPVYLYFCSSLCSLSVRDVSLVRFDLSLCLVSCLRLNLDFPRVPSWFYYPCSPSLTCVIFCYVSTCLLPLVSYFCTSFISTKHFLYNCLSLQYSCWFCLSYHCDFR